MVDTVEVLSPLYTKLRIHFHFYNFKVIALFLNVWVLTTCTFKSASKEHAWWLLGEESTVSSVMLRQARCSSGRSKDDIVTQPPYITTRKPTLLSRDCGFKRKSVYWQ